MHLAPRVPGIGSARTTESLAGTATALLRGRAKIPVPLRDAAAHLLEALSDRECRPAARP
ncbi:hypothetical protein [Streptomyces sp. NPDC059278]|uniref:hypothetical protein n=1 Tax=Streptomyces sp. NPDC059278 TaxID=3346801 RepID=UPI00367608D3